tara:strand:- start:5870 stop:7075 length:1206 start_codon:yes stop_codon:yes gene_type:complete
MPYINLIDSNLSYNEDSLCLNNHPLDEYVQKYKTPFYLYDLSILSQNYTRFFETANASIRKFLICYAVKSNDHSNFLQKINELGGGADVVSIGELAKCLGSGICPSKVVFSGVGKTDDELRQAIDKTDGKIKSINIESIDELKSLISITNYSKKHIDICFRLNPGSPGDTHEHISTGGTHHKFGLLEDEVSECLKLANASKYICSKGISMHIGSQLTSLEETTAALKSVKSLITEYSFLEIINIGGGLGIHYDPSSERLCSLDSYISTISNFLKDNNLKEKEIIFEPGRFLSGNTGILITKVVREKRFFRIVDAGMNDLIRPALYGAHHEIFPIQKPTSPSEKLILTIAGPICETGDFFINRKKCFPLKKGDFAAISNTGAYGKVLASTYNARPLIKEYFI